MIENIVKDLPSQSNTINNDYLNIKKDLENKQNEFDQCQENTQQINNKILIKKDESISTTVNQTNKPKFQRNMSMFDAENDDLTSKLTSYKNEFVRLGEQLKNLNSQYHKIEQIRSTILDKALNACTKLQDETQKLITSVSYQFIK